MKPTVRGTLCSVLLVFCYMSRDVSTGNSGRVDSVLQREMRVREYI